MRKRKFRNEASEAEFEWIPITDFDAANIIRCHGRSKIVYNFNIIKILKKKKFLNVILK